MNHNYLPSLCGKLSIDFQDNFKQESQLHMTDDYLYMLRSARLNLSDKSCCCYCGFQDGRFLELHHKNNNHDDNDPENLFLICTLCHRLKHLGWVGTENLGKIFYIPNPTNLSKSERMWLEPVNIIQRFYLMSEYLSLDDKQRLDAMALSLNIKAMLSAMKRQDIKQNYLDTKIAKARKAEEIEELRSASADHKEKVVDAIEERRKNRVEKVDTVSYFHDLHLLDLLQAISESGDVIKNKYLKEQDDATHGRLTIWFNKTVFAPFEPNPEYTLEDRLNYYQETNYFTSSGLSQIIHQNRQLHQFN